MSRRVKFFALLCVLIKLSKLGLAGDKSPANTPCADQIRYQSDKDDAYKYLENLQRQIYTENPQLTDPYSREELNQPRSVANWAELRARALKACPDPSLRAQCALDPDFVDRLMKALPCLTFSTRFESPLFIFTIDLYAGEIDKIRGHKFPESPVTRFGSLPTGTFDAQAILPPGSKIPLLILNRDIVFFIQALSKAIADSIPITIGKAVELDDSDGGIRRRLRDNPYIVHNFADAISRLVREGSSAGAIEGTLDESHNLLYGRLVGAVTRFLIAHEEAHVILGHVSDKSVEFRLAESHDKEPAAHDLKLGAPKTQILSLPPTNPADGSPTTLKVELRTREQELQADALGFKLMIWSEEQGRDPVAEMVAGAAPQMVFQVLDTANAYGSEAGGWTFSDSNHPTAADRIKALSPVFDEVAKTSKPLRESDFRIPFDAAYKILLEEADPEIRQNLGLPPKKAPVADTSQGGCQFAGQIAYWSDTDDAYRFLENEQRQVYIQNPNVIDAFLQVELYSPKPVTSLQELRDRALKICADPNLRGQCLFEPDEIDQMIRESSCLTFTTRFETPLFLAMINLYTKELDKVRVKYYPDSPKPRFGSLPTGTFQAQALLPQGSKVPLVILDRGIFNFTGAISGAIANSIPITSKAGKTTLDSSERGIRRRLRTHPNITQDFADAVSRLVQDGSVPIDTKATLDREHYILCARILTAMNEFLIAHEEAHVILGHVSDQFVAFHFSGNRSEGTLAPALNPHAPNETLLANANVPANDSSTILKAELRTREQEFEADAVGFRLMLWSEVGEDDPISMLMSVAAPSLVFRILDAVYGYGSEAKGWTFNDANHPTAPERIKALSAVFDEVFKTNKAVRENDFRRLSDAAFKVLLEEADPQIRRNLGLPSKKTK